MGCEIYLVHHGIGGQKWGVRHGPPYPLQKGSVARKQKKAAKRIKKGDYRELDERLSSLKSAKELSDNIKQIDRREAEFTRLSSEEQKRYAALAASTRNKNEIAKYEKLRDQAQKNAEKFHKELNKKWDDDTFQREQFSLDDVERHTQIINELKKEKIEPVNLDSYVGITSAIDMYMRDVGHEDLYKKKIELSWKYRQEANKMIDDYLGKYGDKEFSYKDPQLIRRQKTTPSRKAKSHADTFYR